MEAALITPARLRAKKPSDFRKSLMIRTVRAPRSSRRAILALGFLTVAALPACRTSHRPLATALPETVGVSTEKLRDGVSSVLERYVDSGSLAGVSALVSRGGQVVYEEQRGFQDREANVPMTPDTLFRICSMTKPITSVAAMILVEEGRLAIEDPVSKYIPAFANTQVLEITEDGTETLVPLARAITVEHLLTHTAGLTYAFMGREPWATRYIEAGIANGLVETSQSTIGNAETIAAQPLLFQPGTAWHYSLATDVLGAVVEVASGQPLGSFLRERIFAPLGMNDTMFQVPPEKASRLATVYRPNENGGVDAFREGVARDGLTVYSATYPLRGGAYESGGGGLVSSVRDYARFCHMLLGGGSADGVRILKRETIDLMTRDRCKHLGGLFVNHGDGFGLGFGVVTPEYGKLDLGAPGTFSWGGFYYTYFWIDPEYELVAIVMAQLQPWGERRLWPEFRFGVHAALAK